MRERKGQLLSVPKAWCWLVPAILLAAAPGCDTPSAHTFSRNYGLRKELPVDPPDDPAKFEDNRAEGGRLFNNYCGSCHNARPLGERPFANYQVAVAHMRDQAYLTGKEHRQIIMFLRRWDNVGPPTPPVHPSPKRFVFSQPIAELKQETQPNVSAPPPPPGGGPFRAPANDEQPLPIAPGGSSDIIPPPRPATSLLKPIVQPGSIGPG